MVSLDGTLRYIPLAALHDGERYLTERYALSVFTAAARDKVRLEPKPTWTVAGFGVSQAHDGFAPLNSVPGELAAIVRTAPEEPGVLPGQRQLDAEFTEARCARTAPPGGPHRQPFQPQPRQRIHVVPAARQDAAMPLDRLRALYESFGNLDLLTLSACDTAFGSQTPGAGSWKDSAPWPRRRAPRRSSPPSGP
jgi:CHAT domain-containing protein